MAFPSNNESWSMSIMASVFSIFYGFQSFTLHNNGFLSPAKLYALGSFLISFGIFRVGKRIRYAQIREMGILSDTGGFYKWENIENYRWNYGEDKLSLKLRKAWFKKDVSLKLLSQFRREVVAFLSQNIRTDGNNTKGSAPIQKAG